MGYVSSVVSLNTEGFVLYDLIRLRKQAFQGRELQKGDGGSRIAKVDFKKAHPFMLVKKKQVTSQRGRVKWGRLTFSSQTRRRTGSIEKLTKLSKSETSPGTQVFSSEASVNSSMKIILRGKQANAQKRERKEKTLAGKPLERPSFPSTGEGRGDVYSFGREYPMKDRLKKTIWGQRGVPRKKE